MYSSSPAPTDSSSNSARGTHPCSTGRYTNSYRLSRPSSTTTISIPAATTLPFTATTTTAYPAPCLIEKSYGTHSDTTERIRCFRDTFLTHTPEGLEIIKCYDAWNLLLVEAIEKDRALSDEVKKTIDVLLPHLIQFLQKDIQPSTVTVLGTNENE